MVVTTEPGGPKSPLFPVGPLDPVAPRGPLYPLGPFTPGTPRSPLEPYKMKSYGYNSYCRKHLHMPY